MTNGNRKDIDRPRTYELTITKNAEGKFHFASKDFDTLYEEKMFLSHAMDVLDMVIRRHEFKSFEGRLIEMLNNLEKKLSSDWSPIIDPYSKKPMKKVESDAI